MAPLGILLAGTLACLGSLLFSEHGTECLNAIHTVSATGQIGTKIVLPLAGASAAVWMGRFIWRLAAVNREVRALPDSEELPAALAAAMTRTGVEAGVRCVAADVPTAVCVGALRPRILVSEGLVNQLGAAELDAVLLHEREHVRRFEPLVRAIHDSASEVFFYVPLVRWWSRRRLEESELRADRVALERLGPKPVAAALWALSTSTALPAAAAFAGAAELRIAQLLGEPLPARVPGLLLLPISGLGACLALLLSSCLVHAAQRLI